MAYIATKPVRFGRDYRVGEMIPEGVIAPSMTRKLVEMGRILHIDLPGGADETSGEQQNDPQDGAESAPDSDSDGEGINTQPDGEPPQDGAESGAGGAEDEASGEDTDVPTSREFVCEVCGRAFKSQNALAAHSRSHKE